MSPQYPRGSDLNRNGVDFLRIEISLGNTFMDVAGTSKVLANQQQGRRDAEKAYQSATGLLLKVHLTDAETLEFKGLMAALKARLVAAGSAV
jgi:hypothetical protein